MSTKTLRKRIALVTVAALGFGLVSGTPAQAAGWTSGLSLSHTALTVVGTTETAGASTANGFFYVDTTNLTGTTSTAAALESGESIQATVTAAPTGQAATDLKITAVTNAATAISTAFVKSTSNTSDEDSDATVTSQASPNSSWAATAAAVNESNRYWFAVSTDTASAIGAGKYTIRLRLTNVNTAGAEVKDYTFTVKFVATIADAGAVLTLAKTGSITTGVALNTTANTSVTATLRDADGGRIQMGQAITGTRAGWAPTLNANMMASTTVGESLTIADSGVTAVDHVACATGGAAACTVSTETSFTQALSQAILATGDGTYGVTDTSIAATASSTSEVRVRVTSTAVSASVTVPVITATTATNTTSTTVLLDATGISLANQLARAIAVTSGAGTISYALPLTATTAKLTVDTPSTVAGEGLTATTVWGGSYASASVTPASDNVQTVYTDASGKVVINLTNSAPIATGSATVTITGFATVTDSLAITLTWAAPAIDEVAVTDPSSGIYAKTKAATVFTVRARDQFGNNLSGEQIIPSLSSTSANYSATTTYAPITTGASGTATWTLTDAAATDILGDSITFTSVTNSAKTATYALTYKATLPEVTTLTGFQSSTQADAETVAARGTSISTSSGLTGTLSITKNTSKDMSAFSDATTDDMYAVRIRAVTSTGAAATGATVTLTASTGGHIQNSSGLPSTSRTRAVNADGDAYFRILATATGKLTLTATSGTASFAFPLTIADQAATAGRFVTITGGTTGTANGAGTPVTAAVTDRFGNGVSGVNLVVTASGVGAFMGGSTSQSFTTDATGKYTFLATSFNAAGGAATYSVNASNAGDATSVAKKSGSADIDSTVLAGNSSASVTVTFAEGQNAAEANAQAATDAAAEATDAANAATDAANAAAEAADAATAAAQDAADAVAALSAQVATLISGLKAQLTALTNLVIKIQKKVKA
jgi:hypothetical protein